jgi:hypothetical protein
VSAAGPFVSAVNDNASSRRHGALSYRGRLLSLCEAGKLQAPRRYSGLCSNPCARRSPRAPGARSQKRLSQKHPGRSQARKIGVAPFPKFHSPNGLGRASGRDLLLGFVRCSAAGEVGTSNRLVRDVPVGVSFG